MDFVSITKGERVEEQNIKLEKEEWNYTGAFSYALGLSVLAKKQAVGPNRLLEWLLKVWTWYWPSADEVEMPELMYEHMLRQVGMLEWMCYLRPEKPPAD